MKNGGVGLRTASTLATSAFLASAASTHALQQAILPSSYSNVVDEARLSAEETWKSTSLTSLPELIQTSTSPDSKLLQPHTQDIGSMRRPLRRLALSSLTRRYAYPSHRGWVSPHALLTTAFVGSWLTTEVYTVYPAEKARQDISGMPCLTT